MLEEFFRSLDLGQPGLKEVKEALECKDLQKAQEGLLAYVRTRTVPVPPSLDKAADRANLEEAERVLNHVFTLAGCPPTQIGRDIRWNEDPCSYDQWAIALNRHHHWVTLGKAYAKTGDERYATEFQTQLLSWIGAMPVRIGERYIEGLFDEAERFSLSLDAGIRMGQTWFPALYYFMVSSSFTAEVCTAMLRSFRDHAEYLMEPRHFKSGSNWGTMEANGLFHVGVMLPEFKEAAEWRSTAIRRLYQELDVQVYPDGAQIELAPGYHRVSLSNFLMPLDLAQRNGIPLPADYLGKLERMFECLLHISMPDGRLPALNDSGWEGARDWLAEGFSYFPERSDFQFIATSGKEGTAPIGTSYAFPYAGWRVMRSGWEPDDLYLIFDAGPFGQAHQHEDKLGIILHAGGRTVLTEGGKYSYDDSEWRKYTIGTRSHNTVLVDGMEQHSRGVRECFLAKEPLGDRWITNERFDYAVGEYHEGYGPENDRSVTHTRKILFVKPQYWIVMDELRSADDREHAYESLFHFGSPEVQMNEGTGVVTTLNRENGNLAVVPLVKTGLKLEIVQGSEEPFIQGWVSTGQHGSLKPGPTAAYTMKGSGTVRFIYALVPTSDPADCPVAEVEPMPMRGEEDPSDCTAVKIRFVSGEDHFFFYREKPGRRVQFGGFSTDAEIVLVRMKAGTAACQAEWLVRIGGENPEKDSEN